MLGPKEPTITVSGSINISPGAWIKIDDDFRPTFRLLGHEFKFQWPWVRNPFDFRPFLIVRRIHKYRGVFQVKSVTNNGTTITLTE